MPFEVLPGGIEALGADQCEYVSFAAVFPHESRGEPQPSASLEIHRRAKDRGRKQVRLVVDDEPPGARTEKLEVGELALAIRALGEDLIGGQLVEAGATQVHAIARDDHAAITRGQFENLLLDARRDQVPGVPP
jgi:hypothetical protein